MARIRILVLGAVTAVLFVLVPATNAVAAPATVRISVEGAQRTLIAQRTITTAEATVPRNGAPCPGTSAGGALEIATGGDWGGTFTSPADVTVSSILKEAHPDPVDPRTWALFVNSVPVTNSPCALELNAGDVVLFYVSSLPAGAISPLCRTNGRDGYCGSPDRTGPIGVITSPREQQTFAAKRAPLTISGRVEADPAGLADIRLRITRTRGKRCHFFSGIEETFQRARRCGVAGQQFFSIAQSSPKWSYLLPRRPTPGRYTVDVQAVDRLGNPTVTVARGLDRIVFVVR